MIPSKKKLEEEESQKHIEINRNELIKDIKDNQERLKIIEMKIAQQKGRYQKVLESNLRNQKRLQRYRMKVQEMNKYKDNPEHFLAISGYMNEYIQQYIFSHNIAMEANVEGEPNPDNMTYEQLLDLGNQIGRVSKGLTKQQIERLNHIKNKRAEEKCPICCCELELNELAIQLRCRHTYHEECILLWLKDENTCPICKEYLAE